MGNKCKHAKCDAFARKLTGTEIKNLGGFNLSHQVCQDIFRWTVKGLCPAHAAQFLTEDERPDASIIDVIRRKWNYYAQDNFSDSKGYALCCLCSELLLVDRRKHPVTLIEETLASLYIPEKRIQTILWLQNGASGCLATCFDCSLLTYTDFQYGPDGKRVETELDRLAEADL